MLDLSSKSLGARPHGLGVEPEAHEMAPRVGADSGSGLLRTQLWTEFAVVASEALL